MRNFIFCELCRLIASMVFALPIWGLMYLLGMQGGYLHDVIVIYCTGVVIKLVLRGEKF